ncbi:MAG: hypothetical protein ABWY29_01925 [Blastococcus sp.]
MSERHRKDQARSRWWREPVLLAGAALILLQTIVRARIVLPSYYWADDFLHVELARRVGLTPEFLIRDYNDHLEIGPNVVYWLIGRELGLSFLPAALNLLAMQLVASCLLLSVLRLLFGRSPWILLPFAGYLFTPLGLTAATWWAAGLEALPLQIAMLTALLGLVRAVREPSWRWAALSVAGHAMGLLFWEKAALILPTLIAVLVLVEWAREPLRARLRMLASHWRLLALHGLVLGAYLLLYLSVVDSSAAVSPDADAALGAMGETIFRLLLPGVFGGPWTDAGAENTIFPYVGNLLAAAFALLLLAVVAASVWVRGMRALQAWTLVVGYVAVDLALVQLGRAELLGLIARDPRYITDALPILAIGFCAAFTGPAVTRRTPQWFPRLARSTSAALAAVAFLISSCLLSSFLLADEQQHGYSRNYVHGVVGALAQNPDVSLLSTPTPMNVSLTADLSILLRAVGEEQPFDQPGTDVRMFDSLANLRPITVINPRLQASGPVEDCGWQVAGAWQRLGTLTDPGGGAQVIRLGYMTGQPATLHLRVGGHEQALALDPGLGYATFVITGQQGPVTTRLTDVAEGGMCVTDVVAGAPWPAD